MVQNKAGWMREGRRTYNFSKEAQIPPETIVVTHHERVLNTIEEASHFHLKAPGGFLDATKCPPPFASEQKRPSYLPPPKKNSRKTKAAGDDLAAATSRKEIEAALQEVQESADISEEAKAVLAGMLKMSDRLSVLEQKQKDDAAKPAPKPKVLTLQDITNLGRGNANPVAASSSTIYTVKAANDQSIGASGVSTNNAAFGAAAHTCRRRGEPTQQLVVSQEDENEILRKRINDLEEQLERKDLATDESLQEEQQSHEKTKIALTGLKDTHKKLQQERRILTPQQRADIDLQASRLAAFDAKENEWEAERAKCERQLQNAQYLWKTAERERDAARSECRELDEELCCLRSSTASAEPSNQPRINSRSQMIENSSVLHDQQSSDVDGGYDLLPPNWEKLFSKKAGRPYYRYSDGTNEFSQWHFPTNSEVADPTTAMERVNKNTSEERRKRQRID